jgi:hypothetical protein
VRAMGVPDPRHPNSLPTGEREREGAPRERFVIASATQWSEAIQSEVPFWIASSLPAYALRASADSHPP